MNKASGSGFAAARLACLPVVGDRIRVAHGVFGRPGRVRSISPGHVLIRYDDGGREVVDPSRRPLWVLR
jgi:hypothetical protein